MEIKQEQTTTNNFSIHILVHHLKHFIAGAASGVAECVVGAFH